MIFKTGQVIPVELEVKILAPFAHEDRIYYLVKPLKSYTDSVWIISSDGMPLGNLTSELLFKANRAIEKLDESHINTSGD